MQFQNEQSFFRTRTMGADQGLFDGLIMPFSNIFSTCVLASSLKRRGTLLGACCGFIVSNIYGMLRKARSSQLTIWSNKNLLVLTKQFLEAVLLLKGQMCHTLLKQFF